MTGQYIVQGIFALAGIISLLASLLNWNWFFTTRNARRDAIDALKKAVKEGMPEDEQKNAEAKLQKVHDKYIAKIEELLAEKDKEIMTV